MALFQFISSHLVGVELVLEQLLLLRGDLVDEALDVLALLLRALVPLLSFLPLLCFLRLVSLLALVAPLRLVGALAALCLFTLVLVFFVFTC